MARTRRWLLAITAASGLTAGGAVALARAPGPPVPTTAATPSLAVLNAELATLGREERTLRGLVAAAPTRLAGRTAGAPVHAITGASGGGDGGGGGGGGDGGGG